MSQERKQILTMLAEGKITADEAERLLDKVEPTGSDPSLEAEAPVPPPPAGTDDHDEPEDDEDRSRHRRHGPGDRHSHARKWWGHHRNPNDPHFPFGHPSHGPGGAPKYLRVEADTHDGDKVNIRIPIALLRTGMKLSTVIPPHAQEKLNEKGIDLSGLNGLKGEELIDALRELNVDVVTADGDKVRVFCE